MNMGGQYLGSVCHAKTFTEAVASVASMVATPLISLVTGMCKLCMQTRQHGLSAFFH